MQWFVRLPEVKRFVSSVLAILLAWLLLPATAQSQGSQDAASDIPEFLFSHESIAETLDNHPAIPYRDSLAEIHAALGSPDHQQQNWWAPHVSGPALGFDIINRSVSTRTGIPFIRLNCEPQSDPTWYVYFASDYELEAPVTVTLGPDRARFTLGAYTKAVVDWQGVSRTETFVYTRADDDAEDIVYRLSEYGKESEWDTFIKVTLADANGRTVTTHFDVDLMHTTLDGYGGRPIVLALPPAEDRSRNCHVAVE